MKKAISLFLFLTVFAGFAHAGILIEPNVGYDTGTTKAVDISDFESSSTVSGVSYGLRLGYKFLVPWVALDYSLADLKSEGTDIKRTALGAVIGADLPIGLRIFGGYGFDNKLKVEGGSEFSGTYTKVGLGMSLVPMIALNAEYIMHKMEKIDDADIDTSYKKWEYNSIYLSLSIPFNL